jgi:hypothetical protein
MQLVSRQRIGKHVPEATKAHTIELLLETVFSTGSVQSRYKEDGMTQLIHPVWRRGQYLHRSPASRRKRRKGKSRI